MGDGALCYGTLEIVGLLLLLFIYYTLQSVDCSTLTIVAGNM